jgi:hypothetical protein
LFFKLFFDHNLKTEDTTVFMSASLGRAEPNLAAVLVQLPPAIGYVAYFLPFPAFRATAKVTMFPNALRTDLLPIALMAAKVALARTLLLLVQVLRDFREVFPLGSLATNHLSAIPRDCMIAFLFLFFF